MSSIRNEIFEIINQAGRFQQIDLSDESRSLLDLGLDSLEYATVLIRLQEKFRLQIAERDMAQLGTLKDIVRFVESRRSSAL